MNKRFVATLLCGLALALPNAALAGPYADALSKCLVGSTSEEDRVELVRWMFAAASLHPAVEPFSDLTEEQLDNANKSVADLFTDLLTERCPTETREAFKFEGMGTVQNAFQLLGQVAGQELFASPQVAAGLAGLEAHFDAEKLTRVLELETPEED